MAISQNVFQSNLTKFECFLVVPGIEWRNCGGKQTVVGLDLGIICGFVEDFANMFIELDITYLDILLISIHVIHVWLFDNRANICICTCVCVCKLV